MTIREQLASGMAAGFFGAATGNDPQPVGRIAAAHRVAVAPAPVGRRPPPLLVAHDLDEDKRRLLRDGQIAACCTTTCGWTYGGPARSSCPPGGRSPTSRVIPSTIQVITPYNMP